MVSWTVRIMHCTNSYRPELPWNIFRVWWPLIDALQKAIEERRLEGTWREAQRWGQCERRSSRHASGCCAGQMRSYDIISVYECVKEIRSINCF